MPFIQIAVTALSILLGSKPSSTDTLDEIITSEMKLRLVPGVSLVIIDGGKIVDTRVYGSTVGGGTIAITPATLFQAASISKAVSAFGALRMVEAGHMKLDADVNKYLESWKVPANDFTRQEHVTLRRVLNHSAGLTVHYYPGYDPSEHVPTLVEILEGKGKTPAVVVDQVPGTRFRYSGGGYALLQQLMQDVAGVSFADYMRDNVLLPLGMTHSTFEQPLPLARVAEAAVGYQHDRTAVPGGWGTQPEAAVAGLWTTPTDLAQYVLGVQAALAGKSSVMSQRMAQEMIKVDVATRGLGLSVEGSTPERRRFMHGGRNRGYDSFLVGFVEGGKGAVVMLNANDNSVMMSRILGHIATKYNWPDYPVFPPVAVQRVAPNVATLAATAGRYQVNTNFVAELVVEKGSLWTYAEGMPDEEFIPGADGRFYSTARRISFKPVRNAEGNVEALEWSDWVSERRAPRLTGD